MHRHVKIARAQISRAAKLAIHSIRLISGGGIWTLPSVKLDRFSGAPIDGGLFATECFVDPVFEVELVYTGAHKNHFEALLADIKDDGSGLRLGHGGNRGFGWFTVTGGEA